MALPAQIGALTTMGLKSLPQRALMSLTTIIAVAFVVVVLLGLLAMASGFEKTLEGVGRTDIAVIQRSGATSELSSAIVTEDLELLKEAPQIARSSEGRPLVSGETFRIINAVKRATGTEANVVLRGVGPEALAIRDGGVSLVEGRMPTPGATELIVGRAMRREFTGLEQGEKLRISNTDWEVVGAFEAGGGVFESEIWTDIGSMQSLFRQQGAVQTARLRLVDGSPATLSALQAWIEAEPRLDVEAESERAFFSAQSGNTSSLIRGIGIPMAVMMGLGALFGAVNTMYAAVASRRTEIATLRAIGFSGFAAFVAILVESLSLAVLGGGLGALIAWFAFDGFSASTIGGSFTMVSFAFAITPESIMTAVILALLIGTLGGFFPAFRAARVPILAAYAR